MYCTVNPTYACDWMTCVMTFEVEWLLDVKNQSIIMLSIMTMVRIVSREKLCNSLLAALVR